MLMRKLRTMSSGSRGRQIKVLHLIPSLRPETGGPASSVPALCWAQACLGANARLVVADDSASSYDVPVAHIPARAWLFRSGLPWRGSAIYHVHGLWNPFSTWGMWRLRRCGVAYIVSPRGMLRPEAIQCGRKRIWAALWERKNLTSASAVILSSEDELEAAKACGWDLARVAIIPNPVVMDRWSREAKGGDQSSEATGNTIVFVGRMSKVKRIDLLIRAFPLVKKEVPNAVLKIVGPDWEGIRSKLETLCSVLGVERSVHFLGMKTQGELVEVFQTATVVALVSSRESFGMAAAEAMASGIPVVLTKHVGIAAEAEQAGAAIVVRDTPDDMARGLVTILRRVAVREVMSKAARAFAETNFGAAVVAERSLQLYQSVLNGNARAPQPAQG